MNRLQTLLLDGLHRCFFDAWSTSGFGNGERIVAVRLVPLPKRCNELRRNDARNMTVSLSRSCPVMSRCTGLESNQCRLLFTEELRELAARE